MSKLTVDEIRAIKQPPRLRMLLDEYKIDRKPFEALTTPAEKVTAMQDALIQAIAPKKAAKAKPVDNAPTTTAAAASAALGTITIPEDRSLESLWAFVTGVLLPRIATLEAVTQTVGNPPDTDPRKRFPAIANLFIEVAGGGVDIALDIDDVETMKDDALRQLATYLRIPAVNVPVRELRVTVVKQLEKLMDEQQPGTSGTPAAAGAGAKLATKAKYEAGDVVMLKLADGTHEALLLKVKPRNRGIFILANEDQTDPEPLASIVGLTGKPFVIDGETLTLDDFETADL